MPRHPVQLWVTSESIRCKREISMLFFMLLVAASSLPEMTA